VIPRDELEAQLQILVHDVSGPYAEQETIVVAEIVSRAADQLDVRRDQVPRYACSPGPARLRIAKGPGASDCLQFSGIHVAGFGVDVEVSRYRREIVAAECWASSPTGPTASLTDSGSAEASYYSWVDQHNTFGLGSDTPIATGNANDALLALKDGKFVILRVPYPLGFYAKGLDGRIDDPSAGWKGRALWSTYATRAPFHVEGGKGTQSKVLKFQLRPDPLAR
jgi:hypothetical protein